MRNRINDKTKKALGSSNGKLERGSGDDEMHDIGHAMFRGSEQPSDGQPIEPLRNVSERLESSEKIWRLLQKVYAQGVDLQRRLRRIEASLPKKVKSRTDLSARERQIVELRERRWKIEAIALELKISPSTVKNTLLHIRNKEKERHRREKSGEEIS